MNRIIMVLKKVPGLIWGAFLALIVFSIIAPNFLNPLNLINILNNSSVLLIIACGMTIAILSGQLDISVGGIATLAAMSAGLFLHTVGDASAIHIIMAFIIGIVVGMTVGALNGLLIGVYNYNYWLVTFSTMSIAYGLSQVLTNGNIISGYSKVFRNIANHRLFGMPQLVWIALLVVIIVMFITYKTKFGMHIYAIGDSEQCAAQSGISVKRYRFSIYVIAGGLAGLGGVLLVSRTNSASPIIGFGYEFDAIAAVIIGGTPFSGGSGGVVGTVVGTVMLYAIKAGLQLVGFSVYVQQVFIGIFILSIIVVDVINENRKKEKGSRRVYK